MAVAVEIPKKKWTGQVREVVLGATEAEGGTRSKTVIVGGETTLPFLDFEAPMPNPPRIAVEIQDRRPSDWSPVLMDVWGEAMDDPATWAAAVEGLDVDLVLLKINLTDANGNETTVEQARTAVRKVLDATTLPLIVFGPGQTDKDIELLVAVAEEATGERIVLGVCDDKNYKTIVAAALAHGHLVNGRTAMDVNLAKQLNILISDVGLRLDRVIMDPTTAALGYGVEYGYSAMERLRLAALQGDSMTQQPMLVTPGEEAWRMKEAKVGEDVPAEWGDWEERAITWETLTATTLIHSGADIVVLRHPESVRRIKDLINKLWTKGE
ncbi:MAG: acetyl-CoA decarbonylase/synthase complex subunit delta [Anaerolineae bacterium]|nr:acetyl-CoA decarbonylase/synthase complex subunit delta [Anaerolineae bacterium]NIN95920.1 acetyl-CoA decarbonylase/synthase complex subunit delta [Anaerolineae bacterium]NIQ78884.1 acetyl-CoA decarbonylase/synthase complex subunit delta [Anaerolineae bacterium]